MVMDIIYIFIIVVQLVLFIIHRVKIDELNIELVALKRIIKNDNSEK